MNCDKLLQWFLWLYLYWICWHTFGFCRIAFSIFGSPVRVGSQRTQTLFADDTIGIVCIHVFLNIAYIYNMIFLHIFIYIDTYPSLAFHIFVRMPDVCIKNAFTYAHVHLFTCKKYDLWYWYMPVARPFLRRCTLASLQDYVQQVADACLQFWRRIASGLPAETYISITAKTGKLK